MTKVLTSGSPHGRHLGPQLGSQTAPKAGILKCRNLGPIGDPFVRGLARQKGPKTLENIRFQQFAKVPRSPRSVPGTGPTGPQKMAHRGLRLYVYIHVYTKVVL